MQSCAWRTRAVSTHRCRRCKHVMQGLVLRQKWRNLRRGCSKPGVSTIDEPSGCKTLASTGFATLSDVLQRAGDEQVNIAPERGVRYLPRLGARPPWALGTGPSTTRPPPTPPTRNIRSVSYLKERAGEAGTGRLKGPGPGSSCARSTGAARPPTRTGASSGPWPAIS